MPIYLLANSINIINHILLMRKTKNFYFSFANQMIFCKFASDLAFCASIIIFLMPEGLE